MYRADWSQAECLAPPLVGASKPFASSSGPKRGALSPSTNALKPRGPHMWCNLLSITISLPAWRAYSSALPRALTRYDRRVFRLEPDLTSRRGRPARPRRAVQCERFDYELAPGDDQSLRLPQCAPLTAQGRTGSVASRESLPCACASLWMWPTPRLSRI